MKICRKAVFFLFKCFSVAVFFAPQQSFRRDFKGFICKKCHKTGSSKAICRKIRCVIYAHRIFFV